MSVPDRVGPAELTGFVLIPALLPAIFGGQLTSALVTAGGNALLLALIYAIVGIGLLSILAGRARASSSSWRRRSCCSRAPCRCC